MTINVKILALCLMVIPNSWYLEEIGADTLVFRTAENEKVVRKQSTLLEEYCRVCR